MHSKFNKIAKMFAAKWNTRRTALNIQLPTSDNIKAGDKFECQFRETSDSSITIIYKKEQ